MTYTFNSQSSFTSGSPCSKRILEGVECDAKEIGLGFATQLILETTGARLKWQCIANGPCDVEPSGNGPRTNVAW